LSNPQSLNLYAYAGNNPLSFVDEDGHDGASPTPTCPYGLLCAIVNFSRISSAAAVVMVEATTAVEGVAAVVVVVLEERAEPGETTIRRW
jgi:hypothetical protein